MKSRAGSRPPGPGDWETLSILWSFRRDPFQTLVDLRARYGDLMCYRYGPFQRIQISDPEAAMRVLLDNHTNYDKNSPFYHMLRWFFGDGMIASDGQLWKRQRRLTQPAFQRSKIEALTPMIVSCTEQAMREWQRGASVDAAAWVAQLSLTITGRALFHEDLSEEGASIEAMVKEYQRQMVRRFGQFYPLPPVLPTRADRRFRWLRTALKARMLRMAQKRRAQPDPPDDLLQSLLHPDVPDALLADELLTFLLTGFETVASNLAWVFVLLSRHPDVRRRLEAQEPGLSRRIVLETLRLYPPVCVYGRRCLGPDVLGGYPIRAGQLVSIVPFLLHRHPDYWNNPEGFDPDRFGREPARGAFLPFAAGPRQCIGMQLAELKARLILETVSRSWRLNLVSGARIVPEPLISLQPRFGVPVILEPVGGGDRP